MGEGRCVLKLVVAELRLSQREGHVWPWKEPKVKQELPPGASGGTTSDPKHAIQEQGSPGGKAMLKWAISTAPGGPHADHSLALSPEGPSIEGTTGRSWVCCQEKGSG